MSAVRKIQPRRKVRSVIRNDEDRKDHAQAMTAGREMSTAFGVVTLQILREDLPDIAADIEAGRMTSALGLTAAAMQMSDQELFGLLPAATGAALDGFVRGVLQGPLGRDAVEDLESDEPQPKARRLYGRR